MHALKNKNVQINIVYEDYKLQSQILYTCVYV